MKIAILDQTNGRAIIAQVPAYLADLDRSGDDIAEAIFEALGLSVNDCEYMIGEFDARVCNATINENGAMIYGIEDFTQDFKEDALAVLEDNLST